MTSLQSTCSDASVLYLEDEVLIAMDGEQMLTDIGFRNVISAFTLDRAEDALANGEFDVAILDVHLGKNTTSLDFARTLKTQGVPFLFVTGYNKHELPDDLAAIPVLEKPLTDQKLAEALAPHFRDLSALNSQLVSC